MRGRGEGRRGRRGGMWVQNYTEKYSVILVEEGGLETREGGGEKRGTI